MEQLVIDVGNTFVKCGVFINDDLNEKQVFLHKEKHLLRQWLTNHSKPNIIISDVTSAYIQWITDLLPSANQIILMSAAVPLPIKNGYETPNTLGQDRIAAAVGATVDFPEKDCLVIDAGTCITYDYIDQNLGFRGGSISPGINLRFWAMHKGTGNLPLVEKRAISQLFGTTTETALQSGVFWGVVTEVEGIIERYQLFNPEVKIILTGGDAIFLANHSKKKIFVNQNLVLQGLNKILMYNAA